MRGWRAWTWPRRPWLSSPQPRQPAAAMSMSQFIIHNSPDSRDNLPWQWTPCRWLSCLSDQPAAPQSSPGLTPRRGSGLDCKNQTIRVIPHFPAISPSPSCCSGPARSWEGGTTCSDNMMTEMRIIWHRPDEEHGLAPAGLLRVPGVTQHQPLDPGLPHGADHGLGGLSVAPDQRMVSGNHKIKVFIILLYSRHFRFLWRESQTWEDSVLAPQLLLEAVHAEDVGLHHLEVVVAEGHLGGVPHQGRHRVVGGQRLLHCLQTWDDCDSESL